MKKAHDATTDLPDGPEKRFAFLSGMSLAERLNDPEAESEKFTPEQRASFSRYAELLEGLMKKQPEMGITNSIIAGDMQSAEAMGRAVDAKEISIHQAIARVGSYARLTFAEARLTRQQFVKILPALWPQCDPDDTDLSYLDYWREVKKNNGGKIYCDGPALDGRNHYLYRGQSFKEKLGFAWTTDRKIGIKFAHGAGVRRPLKDGALLRTGYERAHVLAFLTARGESEIILDIEAAGLSIANFYQEGVL